MKKVDNSLIFRLCLPQFAVGLFTTMLNNYLIYFYQPSKESGIPNLIPQGRLVLGVLTIIGMIKAIGHIIDAVTDPLIAASSDKSRHKDGRRIPMMKKAAIPFPIRENACGKFVRRKMFHVKHHILRGTSVAIPADAHYNKTLLKKRERRCGMGNTLALVNQKGGVGKTTTAVNLTAALHQAGLRVLLCDFDPQANATSGLGLEKGASAVTSYDVVINGAEAKEAVIHTKFGDLIPSSAALSGAGVELVGVDSREYALKNALAPLKDSYDAILIDCPPSLELLTLNALCAADSVLIPVQCEYYALEGLSDLMTTMRAVKRRLNPRIDIFGVVLTMYDGRTNFSAQVAEEVRRHFPGKVFATAIPRNVRLCEAPSHGLPVFAYDRYSRGAQAYLALAEEILKKLR